MLKPFDAFSVIDEIKTGRSHWIELFAYGISVASPKKRPVLILKDQEKDLSLPVWISSLDAAVAMVQSNPRNPASSPHQVTEDILKSLDLKLTHCLFTDIIGHHQYVYLCMIGEGVRHQIRCRAEDTMSLCTLSKVKFYCLKDLITESREIDFELRGYDNYWDEMLDGELSNSSYLN